MKRLIYLMLCILLSLLLCAFLSGCGEDDGDDSATKNPPVSSDTENGTEYKITFVQDGQDSIVKTVKKGGELKDIPTPLAPLGYTAAWDRDSFSNIQADMTVNAVYTMIEYRIIYNLGGGINSPDNRSVYTINERVPLYEPKREGYRFDGWYTDSNYTSRVTEIAENTANDTVIFAKWTFMSGHTFLVTFDSCGGTPIESAEVGYLAHVKKPQDPKKDGYTFLGWYLDGEKWSFAAYTVSYDIILTAKWEANVNTVVFSGNGADEDGPYTMYMETDERVRLMQNRYTKKGYEFLGWSASADGEVEYEDCALYTMGAEAEYTLYAIWSPKRATVNIESNGSGEKRYELTGLTNEGVTLPRAIFERAGYTLLGWSKAQNGSVDYELGAEYVIGTDSIQTLYAKWQANENTLILDPNGGEGKAESIALDTDEIYTLEKCKFARTGYVFAGWATSSDGKAVYGDCQSYVMGPKASYTLYAVWEYEMYPIKYVLGGGTNSDKNPLEYNMFNTYELYVPTLKGYSFEGWYTDSALTCRAEKIYESTKGELTFYAKWKLISYTITYNKNGGECTDKTVFTVNDLPVYRLETPVKNGYLFEGWCLDEALEGELISSITEIGDYELFAKYAECTDGIELTEDSLGWVVSGYAGGEKNILFPSEFRGRRVYKIGDNAFKDKDFITGISLPSSVTEVGQSSFSGCAALVDIDISHLTKIGSSAFSSCSSLKEISLCKELTRIGWYAFSQCTGLNKIYYNAINVEDSYFKSATFTNAGTEGEGISLIIGKDVKSIPAEFMCTTRSSNEDAPYVTSLTFEDGCAVEKIGDYAFKWLSIKELTLPGTVTYVGTYLFGGSKTLEIVEIGEGITEIGDYMFSGCSSLSSIKLPESVLRIRSYAFHNCASLEEISLPSDLITIGDKSFGSCISLKTIIIPQSTRNVYSHAFMECFSLTICVEGSSDNRSFSSDWNSGRPVIWNYAGDMGVTESGISWVLVSETEAVITGYSGPVAEIEIPSTVEGYTVIGIGENAFHKSPYVSGIKIPSTVKTIGANAFKLCYKLARVEIEKGGLEEIGDYAFSRCEELMEIVIPSGKIGRNAFYANYDMQSITICGEVSFIGKDAFGYCNKLTIYMLPITVERVCETDWNSSYCKVQQITE